MICPKCKSELVLVNNTYKCSNNHSYDISKNGYVNLLLSKTNSGDNNDLVKARVQFLNNSYYQELGLKINEIINSIGTSNKVLDCGCGVGYYDTFIKNQCLYLMDISKYAIIQASKVIKNSEIIVASNSNIPYQDKYFDIALYIFSPLFINETKRVLNNKGIIINVTPGANHLFELKELLYKDPYLNKDTVITIDNYNKETINLKYQKVIPNDDLHNLINMTPYAYKTNKEDIDNLKIDKINVTFDFLITIYKPIN